MSVWLHCIMIWQCTDTIQVKAVAARDWNNDESCVWKKLSEATFKIHAHITKLRLYSCTSGQSLSLAAAQGTTESPQRPWIGKRGCECSSNKPGPAKQCCPNLQHNPVWCLAFGSSVAKTTQCHIEFLLFSIRAAFPKHFAYQKVQSDRVAEWTFSLTIELFASLHQ